MRKQKREQSKLVNIINSSILFVFGILFLIFGIQKGDGEGWMMTGFGVLFLIIGLFRTFLIVRLMKEVEAMNEEERSLLEIEEEPEDKQFSENF